MTRKGKAVWIGFLAPVIMGWVVTLFVLTRLRATSQW